MMEKAPIWVQYLVTYLLWALAIYVFGYSFPLLAATKTMFSGDTATTAAGNATTFFDGNGSHQSATENATVDYVIPVASTGTALYCEVGTAPGTGASDIITVRKASAIGGAYSSTALTCTIANTNTTCNVTGTSVSFTAGDVVHFQTVNSVLAAAGVMNCGVALTQP